MTGGGISAKIHLNGLKGGPLAPFTLARMSPRPTWNESTVLSAPDSPELTVLPTPDSPTLDGTAVGRLSTVPLAPSDKVLTVLPAPDSADKGSDETMGVEVRSGPLAAYRTLGGFIGRKAESGDRSDNKNAKDEK